MDIDSVVKMISDDLRESLTEQFVYSKVNNETLDRMKSYICSRMKQSIPELDIYAEINRDDPTKIDIFFEKKDNL